MNYILALDLDKVLWDTDRFKELLIEACNRELGISREDYNAQYKLASKSGYYSQERFVNNLARNRNDITKEKIGATFAKVLIDHAAELAYEDAIKLLNYVRNNHKDVQLTIVTRGTELQLDKITKSGLAAYFCDQIYVVNVKPKWSILEGLLPQADGIIFIDDQVHEIQEVVEYYSDSSFAQNKLQCVWLNRDGRGSGDLHDGVSEVIPTSVLAIASLGDLQKMLPRLLSAFKPIRTRYGNDDPYNFVSIGGGTGQSELLRGLKKFKSSLELKSVATTVDDGSSSGIFRDEFNQLPPGDVAKNILALVDLDDEEVLRKVFLKRWPVGNHSLLNVVIAGSQALNIAKNFQQGADVLKFYLGGIGRSFGVAKTSSDLHALFCDGRVVSGEESIDHALETGAEIEKVYLDPKPQPNAEVVEAVEEADVICIGPGSFYTSILPNLLVDEVKMAIAKSRAPIIFVMNLLTEGKGMKDYTARRIVETLESYIGRPVSKVLVNGASFPPDSIKKYYEAFKFPIVYADFEDDGRCVVKRLWTDSEYARHNSDILADKVFELTYELLNTKN